MIVVVLRTEETVPVAHAYGVQVTRGDRTVRYTECGRYIGRLAARLPWRHARLFCVPCRRCWPDPERRPESALLEAQP